MKIQYSVPVAMLAGMGISILAVHTLQAQARPPAYIITEVQIIDEAAFKEFSPKVGQATQAAGGKYLVRGGQVVALEGEAPKRVIVNVFESVEKAKAYRDSAAWKELTPLREKAVKSRAYIVEGLPQQLVGSKILDAAFVALPANALRLSIPPSLLARADEVIE